MSSLSEIFLLLKSNYDIIKKKYIKEIIYSIKFLCLFNFINNLIIIYFSLSDFMSDEVFWKFFLKRKI